jgi:hypothetical protein
MLRAASKAVASRLHYPPLLAAAAGSDLLESSSCRLFSQRPGQSSAEREAAAHAAAQDLAGAAQDSVSGSCHSASCTCCSPFHAATLPAALTAPCAAS